MSSLMGNYAVQMVLVATGLGSLPFLWRWGFKKEAEVKLCTEQHLSQQAQKAIRKAAIRVFTNPYNWEEEK